MGRRRRTLEGRESSEVYSSTSILGFGRVCIGKEMDRISKKVICTALRTSLAFGKPPGHNSMIGYPKHANGYHCEGWLTVGMGRVRNGDDGRNERQSRDFCPLLISASYCIINQCPWPCLCGDAHDDGRGRCQWYGGQPVFPRFGRGRLEPSGPGQPLSPLPKLAYQPQHRLTG